MGNIKHLIYKVFIAFYNILPFKRHLCHVLRFIGLPHKLIYKDLKFFGPFKVKVPGSGYFKMMHYGGSIENETFWKGLFKSWESETGWVWIELCRYSKVIFDIGANTGIYSLTAACINSSALIFAFEPSEKTFLKLCKNVDLNKYKIRCEKIALSSITGEQVFYDVPDENQTSASLSPLKLKLHRGYVGEISEYKVKTYTLSDYLKERQFWQVDLIKIDVELHEPEVIRGFGKFLSDFEPIILIEVLTEDVARQLNSLIPENKFYKFILLPSKEVRFRENFSPDPASWNYLVISENKLENLKSSSSALYLKLISEINKMC